MDTESILAEAERVWQKHLTALKLKSKFGDDLAEKYWNELTRLLKRVDSNNS